MKTFITIFGEGTDLSPLQMAARAVLVFTFTLLFIRLSGRRSFGMHMPIDNVVTILLGAVLSRAIVGASPLIGTLLAGLVIVILYRLASGLAVYSKWFGRIVKGKVEIVYDEGKFYKDKMSRCMVTEKDLEEQIRLKGIDSFDKVKSIHVERNGEISVVKISP
jgi:uncharacterized membrane protein YcaP (DUF421 family)